MPSNSLAGTSVIIGCWVSLVKIPCSLLMPEQKSWRRGSLHLCSNLLLICPMWKTVKVALRSNERKVSVSENSHRSFQKEHPRLPTYISNIFEKCFGPSSAMHEKVKRHGIKTCRMDCSSSLLRCCLPTIANK